MQNPCPVMKTSLFFRDFLKSLSEGLTECTLVIGWTQ